MSAENAVELKEFTLYWRDGKREVLRGDSPADAMNRVGYGGGAVRALDFYANGDDKEYVWDASKKDWTRVKPFFSGADE